MQLIEWPRFVKETSPLGETPSAVTVGVFDGVHRGHKILIEKIAAYNSARPVVVTFRHSRYKKNLKRENPGDIQSFRQKIEMFESLGVDAAVVIEFSESFRHITGTDFLETLRGQGKMIFMAVGSNFRCGYQLDTDAAAARESNARLDIPTDIVETLTEGSVPISSSQIRAALARGELKTAAAMLGRPFVVDLAGAPAVSSGSGTIYDIAGLGRILPPPGRYPVFLLGRGAGGESGRTPAEITVEGGCVKIGGLASRGASAAGFRPEYIEFAL